MAIPNNFTNLREALNDLPRLSRTTNSSAKLNKNDPVYNHPFSDRNGLRLLSIQPGHVEAEQTTNAEHINSHGSVHGGLITSSTDATMAATAQSSVGKKQKNKIAVVKDFAQRFFKPVFPGQKLNLVSEQVSSEETDNKSIKYIRSEIRRGDELVGQAISTYFIVDKDEYTNPAD